MRRSHCTYGKCPDLTASITRKLVRGGSYAYCDADGNYYPSGFGLHY